MGYVTLLSVKGSVHFLDFIFSFFETFYVFSDRIIEYVHVLREIPALAYPLPPDETANTHNALVAYFRLVKLIQSAILNFKMSECRLNSYSELFFNIDDGYLEGIVRGLKNGVLTQTDYLNLVQCETLEGEFGDKATMTAQIHTT